MLPHVREGRRACFQLVRAVASAGLTRNGCVSARDRAAAARALEKIHTLTTDEDISIFDMLVTPVELHEAASALLEVYSVSLREVGSLGAVEACDGKRFEMANSSGFGAEAPKGSAAKPDCRHSAAAAAAERGASAEEWVPLLVDSSALVANCLHVGFDCISDSNDTQELYSDSPPQRLAMDGGSPPDQHNIKHMHSCAVSMVSALLHSDALLALSRLLSAEAQRGPAGALLKPRQLATCLEPLKPLAFAITEAPTSVLPAKPQSPSTTLTSGRPSSQISRPQRLGAAVLSALAESGVLEAACKLVVRTARDAAQRPGSRRQQQQQQESSGAPDHAFLQNALYFLLMEVGKVLDMDIEGLPTRGLLPSDLLRRIITGPCTQYALAAHSVSQLHAVDGGTTYGLPYDNLMPPLRELGSADLSSHCLATATSWWMHVCRKGGTPPSCSPYPRPLYPRGLFELCLRTAEVAADCWRRRNGLPAVAAAAEAEATGGAAGACGGKATGDEPAAHEGRQGSKAKRSETRAEASGAGGVGHTAGERRGLDRGSSSRSSSSKGRIAGGTAGPSCGTGHKGPRATLDADLCPWLTLLAVNCTRMIMDRCSGDGAAGGSGDGAAPVSSWASGSSSDVRGRVGGGRAVGSGCSSGGGACAKGGGANRAQEPDADASSSSGSRTGSGLRGGSGTGSRDGGEGKRLVTWIGAGGPLALRWWRAAVAAVHCGLDNMALGDDARTAFNCCLAPVLNLSPFMPPASQCAGEGPALPSAPPGVLSAALDAGYLPCLERMLRCGLRSFSTVGDLALVLGMYFGVDIEGPSASSHAWSLMLPYGREREAAAWLATTAKMVRRVLVAADPGRCEDVSASMTVTQWVCYFVRSFLWEAAEGAATGLGQQQPAGGRIGASPSHLSPAASGAENYRSSEDGGTASGSSGSGSIGSGGAGSSGGEGCAPSPGGSSCLTDDPSPLPTQQRLRLLSFALPLWLPLFTDMPALCSRISVAHEVWVASVGNAVPLLGLGFGALALASQRGDTRAAESWRAMLLGGQDLPSLLASWRERLERKGAGRKPQGSQAEVGLLAGIRELEMQVRAMDSDSSTLRAPVMLGVGTVAWPLVGLLAPPCEARQVLACCSNPRCAELAGDSEAGVVLRRCGGACGGAAAYCCAACQRAHWAAGHREECTGKRRGGGRAGAAGSGQKD